MRNRPYVLTIAGFDPSSGAGLTADIKTFEALKTYGLAVCTANTIQNDAEFEECHWIDVTVIKSQISILFKKFNIEYVKIGIVQSWSVLNKIIDFLIAKNDEIKIILDPVLTSSSNYDFHTSAISSSDFDVNQDCMENPFDQMLDKIYLLTPNYQEIQGLYPNQTIEGAIKHISSKTNLFLKGGHREDALGKDQLFMKGKKYFPLNPKGNNNSEKHGSGCVLSSAITSYLALGFPLLKACYRGKRYTEKVLSSNKGLLGFHKL